MDKDKPVFVGFDGSNASLIALDWAVDEAVVRGAQLSVVHASRWEHYEIHGPAPVLGTAGGAGQDLAENIVGAALERVHRRAPTVKATIAIKSDDPAHALVELSREASAIVVGDRGRGGLAGLLLGSVGLAIAARSAAPVVVVRGGERNIRRGFHRIVVGVDEPEKAVPSLEFALNEAEAHGAELMVVHTWRCPAGEFPDFPVGGYDAADFHRGRAEDAIARALSLVDTDTSTGTGTGTNADAGVDTDTDTDTDGDANTDAGTDTPVHAHSETRTVSVKALEGHPRPVLLDAARTADLLVVGAHRRAGHLGMQLGPVNHAMLHLAPCPVAVIPHV